MKTVIVRELGQSDILLPSLVAEGLAANDRIKLRLSALQAAAQHAREPSGAVAAAAYLHLRDALPGGRTAAVLSGGNLDPALFARILADALTGRVPMG